MRPTTSVDANRCKLKICTIPMLRHHSGSGFVPTMKVTFGVVLDAFFLVRFCCFFPFTDELTGISILRYPHTW